MDDEIRVGWARREDLPQRGSRAWVTNRARCRTDRSERLRMVEHEGRLAPASTGSRSGDVGWASFASTVPCG